MIFSVSEYSIWDIFPWQMFLAFYFIAAILLIFPKSSKMWPFSTFSFLSKLGRWNGVVTLAFVSLIAVPHFLMTNVPLKNQKDALELNNFSTIQATFDGHQVSKKIAFSSIPETTLSFDGTKCELPGSLHGGLNLVSEIQNQLEAGKKYKVSIFRGVVLEIVELN